MAIYVDPTNGNNANSGASGFPVRDVQRALDAASANEEIILQNTSLSSPARLLAKAVTDVTIKPESGMGYMTAAQNVSHGAEIEDTLYRSVFTSDLQSWTAQNASISAADPLYGAGSLLIDASASLAYIRKTTNHYGRRMKIRLVYKTGGVGEVLKLRVQGSTQDYNFTTGAFETGTILNDLPESPSGYTEYTTDWIEGASDTESGFIYLQMGGTTGTAYVQEFHIIVDHQWIDAGDGTWYAKYRRPVNSPSNDYSITSSLAGRTPNTALSGLFKGNLTDYANMRIVETDGSAPTVAGYSYYDNTASRLIYKPLDGEVVTNLHFEQLFGSAALNPVACDVNCYNIAFTCNQLAVRSETSGTSTFRGCIEQVSTIGGVSNKDASNIYWYGGSSRQPIYATGDKYQGGGFVAGTGDGSGTGLMHVEGVPVIYAGDDSFQPADSTEMHIHGCTSFYSKGTDIEISFQTASGVLTCQNFSGYGSALNSFRDQHEIGALGGHTVTLKNCAFYSEGTNDMYWTTVGDGTYTVENVYYGTADFAGTATQIPAAITNDATVLATPPYTNATGGDFTPTSGSDFVASGVKWWTGANPVGADGEPFSDIDTDIGGIQSKHGPFHPVNL